MEIIEGRSRWQEPLGGINGIRQNGIKARTSNGTVWLNFKSTEVQVEATFPDGTKLVTVPQSHQLEDPLHD